MSYRILHVIPGLGDGGAEHQLLMNIERLNHGEFDNHVCHLYPRTILAPALEEAGATIHSAAVSGPLGGPRRLLNLVRVIRRVKPDLIHTSNVLGEMYGGVAGRLTGVPVVGTLTNTSDPDVRLKDNPHLNDFKLKTVGFFRRQLVRRTHSKQIAISKHVAESASSQLGIDQSRISVIYRGIDANATKAHPSAVAAIREEFGLRTNSLAILTVGRLVPQKGQRYLIDAMPKILDRYPEAVLLIVGIGFLEEKLRKQVESLGLEDHVRFLGRRADVATLLQAVDVFVFPSLFEGLGVSMLEASFSGTPVVATDTGPIPEIVIDGETGLLVTTADSNSIVSAVSQLAADKELRLRLGLAATERTSRYFNIDRAVDMLEELYVSVIGRPSNRIQPHEVSDAR